MITSVKNKVIQDLIKLKKKKERDLTNQFLVEGYHLVEEAKLNQLLIKTIGLDDTCDIVVSKEVLEKLAFTKTPQPIMGLCKKKTVLLDYNQDIIVGDGIQDPGNIGTIMRSALAFGYHQLLLSKDSVDIYNDKVIRATQGAIFKINVVYADLKEIIPTLKNNDYQILGTTLKNSIDIKKVNLHVKKALIFGNEGQGISPEIQAMCDQNMIIPISEMESLNVAIACAIVLYESRREK